jgi:hypothetical protein
MYCTYLRTGSLIGRVDNVGGEFLGTIFTLDICYTVVDWFSNGQALQNSPAHIVDPHSDSLDLLTMPLAIVHCTSHSDLQHLLHCAF